MNNKGMTIVELITSIVLVSIILVFMLNLLITLQNFNVQNQNETDLLINQAVIIKAIEKDFNEFKLKEVANCTIDDLGQNKKYPIVPNNYSNLYCLKLTFDNSLIEDNVGYLMQYTYNYNDNSVKNVVGYKRGSNQTIRESKIQMNASSNKGKVTSSCVEHMDDDEIKNCSLKIVMPIYDEVGNNYDIIATYIYKKDELVYRTTSNEISNDYGFEIK